MLAACGAAPDATATWSKRNELPLVSVNEPDINWPGGFVDVPGSFGVAASQSEGLGCPAEVPASTWTDGESLELYGIAKYQRTIVPVLGETQGREEWRLQCYMTRGNGMLPSTFEAARLWAHKAVIAAGLPMPETGDRVKVEVSTDSNGDSTHTIRLESKYPARIESSGALFVVFYDLNWGELRQSLDGKWLLVHQPQSFMPVLVSKSLVLTSEGELTEEEIFSSYTVNLESYALQDQIESLMPTVQKGWISYGQYIQLIQEMTRPNGNVDALRQNWILIGQLEDGTYAEIRLDS